MKVIVWLSCLLILLGCSQGPEFEMSDGERRALGDYSGQWVLVNYWAVWCKPCVEEIPELNAAHAQPGITVIGYNFDQTKDAQLADQMKQLKIAFPVTVSTPDTLLKLEAPGALPATMLISPAGQFKEWLMGPQTLESIQRAIADVKS